MELEPWVWWTLLAAMMQAVRTAGQKQLTAAVTPLAATLVRYLFGLPFALLWLTYAGATLNFDFPDLNLTFLVSGLIAGILQIVATLLLVRHSKAKGSPNRYLTRVAASGVTAAVSCF